MFKSGKSLKMILIFRILHPHKQLNYQVRAVRGAASFAGGRRLLKPL